MHFHAIAERPSATPHPGVSWLLLGFVVVSLSVHALFFIPGEQATPFNIMHPGTPYIRVTLNHASQADAKSTAKKTVTTENTAQKKIALATEVVQPSSAIETTHKRTLSAANTEALQQQPAPRSTRVIKTSQMSAMTPAETTDISGSFAQKKPANKATTQRATDGAAHVGKNQAERNEVLQHEALRNYLLGELRDQLSRYLTYPQRARRRGWEGEVLLELDISTQGQLQNIQLVHSSGYAPLDRSALKSLSQVDKLHLPSTAILQQAVSLQLPVVYRLSRN